MDAPQTNDANYGDAIEPIAIVGISCRFPGQVSSPDQFWDMLVHGRSGHCEVPTDRFHADTWRHPDHDRKGAVR
jgi:acyl transferase domain-containing protein